MDPKTSGAGTQTFPGAEVPTLDQLNGMEVRDRSREKIGTVKDIYTDREGGNTLRYLSITTGWLGTRRHVVPLDDIEWSAGDGFLTLPYGREELESAPTYEAEHELSSDDETSLYGYYGRPGYWEAVRAKQTTPSATPEIAEADVAKKLARGKDPLRKDPNGGSGAVGPNDPGPRTMSNQGASRFRAHEGQRGVRRYQW